MAQFSNTYLLDILTGEWKKSETGLGQPRWNFTAVSVKAVPFSKIFLFGGNSGDLEDGNPQGTYLNDMIVLETGLGQWTTPNTLGSLPAGRGESGMVYDPKKSQIIMFGGWANRFFFAFLSYSPSLLLIHPPHLLPRPLCHAYPDINTQMVR